MKVLVQWTTRPVRGYEEVDLKRTAWRDLPKKPHPGSLPPEQRDERIDSSPGWTFAVCVQGTSFMPDHIAVELDGDDVVVWEWNDDPPATPRGERHGRLWRFRPLLRPLNTDITVETYAEKQAVGKWVRERHHTWQKFPFPDEALIRHGVWVSDDLAEKHNAKRRRVSWREWA